MAETVTAMTDVTGGTRTDESVGTVATTVAGERTEGRARATDAPWSAFKTPFFTSKMRRHASHTIRLTGPSGAEADGRQASKCVKLKVLGI